MAVDPKIDATLLAEGTAQAETLVNTMLARMLAGLMSVKSATTGAPPGSPSNFDAYILPSGSSGDWSGYDTYVAIYVDGWIYMPPAVGMRPWVEDAADQKYWNGSAWASYGGTPTPVDFAEIYIKDGSTAQNGLGTTPVLMENWAADGESESSTPDFANNKITVGTTGIYKVHLSLSFSGTANAEFQAFVRIDGVESVLGLQRKMGSGGDIGSANTTGLLSLTAGEDITVYIETDDGGAGDAITAVQAHLAMFRLQ